MKRDSLIAQADAISREMKINYFETGLKHTMGLKQTNIFVK